MNKKRIWNILTLAIWLLQLVAEALTVITIKRLDVLPGKYFAILLVLFALAGLGVGALLLWKSKKRSGNVRRIIACALALIVAVGCAVIVSAVSQVYSTLHGISNPVVVTDTRGVYVHTDDPAQSLADVDGYKFGIVTGYDEEKTAVAIDMVQKEASITVEHFENLHELIEALYNEQVEAIVLNTALVEIVEEEEGFEDFSSKVRLLAEVTVEEKVVETTPPSTEAQGGEDVSNDEPGTVVVPGEITQTPFVVYISGSDTRSSKLNVNTRSDVNILAVINPVTKQALLLNTPRDAYVANPAGNDALDKLTHCGIYGVDNSQKALAQLFDVDINYMAKINFTGFETLIDAIGGVTVYSDAAFTRDGVYISKGENHLDGREALVFARERKQLANGDHDRGKNQMKVISAVIKKATSGTTILTNYSAILNSLEGMFVTDLSVSDMSNLVKMQVSDMASWDIYSYAVTGTGGSAITYSWAGKYLYVMYPNENSVAHASELINRVLAGEILTEDDI